MKTWAIMLFIMFVGLWISPLGFIMAAGFTAFAAASSIPLALSQQADDVKTLGNAKRKELGW